VVARSEIIRQARFRRLRNGSSDVWMKKAVDAEIYSDAGERRGQTCLSGTFPSRFRERALVRNERTIVALKSISSNNRDLSICESAERKRGEEGRSPMEESLSRERGISVLRRAENGG